MLCVNFIVHISFVDEAAWKSRNIEDKLWTDDWTKWMEWVKNPEVYVFGCKMYVQMKKKEMLLMTKVLHEIDETLLSIRIYKVGTI